MSLVVKLHIKILQKILVFMKDLTLEQREIVWPLFVKLVSEDLWEAVEKNCIDRDAEYWQQWVIVLKHAVQKIEKLPDICLAVAYDCLELPIQKQRSDDGVTLTIEDIRLCTKKWRGVGIEVLPSLPAEYFEAIRS